MSHIELDVNDLTNLSDKIKEIKIKISNLETIIDSKFGRAKKHELYVNGFKKVKNYLEDQATRMSEMKRRLEKYQSGIISVEKAYTDRFNDIAIPSFQSTASSLNVTRGQSTLINNNLLENQVMQSSENVVTYQSSSSEESSGGGLSNWGSLAAAAGVVGAGGFGTAAYIRSKTKDEEEKKENKEGPKYVTMPTSEHSQRNMYPFILEEQNKETQPISQPVSPQTPGNMFPYIMGGQQVQPTEQNNVLVEE